ncbi:MAG: prepilin-type N-terminal cleavage/methylation domain-containing protein, partial [Pseudomonadales bacterium]|nr:prepilin-type N-terminal cleavage/methylation domain-containing protein [Pseudomonadales bacterium]
MAWVRRILIPVQPSLSTSTDWEVLLVVLRALQCLIQIWVSDWRFPATLRSICALHPEVLLFEVRVGSRAKGFTLVELVMTILVMSISMIGLSSALGFGLRHQSDGV